MQSLEQELVALAHPTGGWGYTADQKPAIESTCIALLALAGSDQYREVKSAALHRLQSFRRPDGSYRWEGAREEAIWGTALALVVLNRYQGETREIESTASFLLGIRGKPGQEDPETDTAFDIDIRLIGWPWAEGTFSWVEPTAWACLALQQLGQSDHPRVQEGLKVLVNRAFDTGGANYGNKRVLEKTTEPIPGPSAIALLALQKLGHEPRVRATIDYVKREAEKSTDPEHLAQAKIGLVLHGAADLAWLDQRIEQALTAERARTWAAKSALKLAWPLLALRADQCNPLSIQSADSKSNIAEKEMTTNKRALGERIRLGLKSLIARGLDRMRQPPPRSVVHIAKASSYDDDLTGIVKQQYESFRALVPLAGKRVVLKPNLVEYHRDKVINTHPRVIGAVIQLCKDEGAAEIIVAEGPGHWRNVQYLVTESGLGDVLQDHGVQFVDLNHDEPIKLLNLGRLTGLEHLFLAKTVAEAEVLISIPKLKTHHWAGATLSLKNLFGTLPGTCYGWPKNELHWRGIAESIIDIALTCTPHLAIVDGIIGMEGDGPLNGTARPVGALIMGNDLVATDATGCRLMGLPAERIVHVALGAHKRLGRIKSDEIEMVGASIDALKQQFELPPRFEKITLPVDQAS